MAYEIIGTYPIYEYEQEEQTETKQVAGDDGVVTTVTEVLQQYVKLNAELIVKQERNVNANESKIRGEVWVHCTAGEYGDGITLQMSASSNYLYHNIGAVSNSHDETSHKEIFGNSSDLTFSVASDETQSIMIAAFNSDSNNLASRGYLYGTHNLDGTLTDLRYEEKNSSHIYGIGKGAYTIFTIDFRVRVKSISELDGRPQSYWKSHSVSEKKIRYNPLPIDRSLIPVTADNFTDEENPSFTYNAVTGRSTADEANLNITWICGIEDYIVGCQAALSFDGVTADIAYRDIPTDANTYTFVLTDSERELLRTRAQGNITVPIYFLTKITRQVGGEGYGGNTYSFITQMPIEFINTTKRNLTIVGAEPSLNPTVKDIKLETLALTGNENTFIRYESMAEYEFNATASKNAEIVSYSVQCGSKVISDLPQGIIQDTESGSFIFNIRDSRNLSTQTVVSKSFVEYVKPTCYQKLEIELSGDVGATVKLNVSGSYYNGSFGAADNTLKLEMRYGPNEEELGEWITLTNELTPVFADNGYELETTIEGLEYSSNYVFQCRATDKLNVVQSSQYTIKLLPVFDWSEEDFNFNVPVNIDSDTLSMHGNTVLRHGKDTNNTVLSANEGHIYIRPGGTDNTIGESIIYPDGSITFGGVVNFGESIQIDGSLIADFVIESGTASMGSNGTWQWRKWKSGKAECWGCRNFGNMAVSTAWGNLYRGAILTQDLPEDLFARTPDSININIVHGNYGGWICKHEQTAPSAITTGSFIFVRPASATVSPTNIGFYIIGEWE